MFTTSYTVSHRSLSKFVAVVVEGFASSVAVQNPTHLYSRRDGKVTVRAADRRNTQTFSTHRVNFYGILPNGERETLRTGGPKPQPEQTVIPQNYLDAAAALDYHKPGWYDMVDLSSLNQAFGHKCVLGQTFATEGTRAGTNGWYWATEYNSGPRLAVRHSDAFAGSSSTSIWREVIRQRRGY